MSQWLPYAPIEAIEVVIERMEKMVTDDQQESVEYKYWYQWLFQTIGHLGKEDWKKIRKRIKKMESIQHFTPHSMG